MAKLQAISTSALRERAQIQLSTSCRSRSPSNKTFEDKARNTLGIMGYATAIPAEAA